jgi:hypothetical protein
MELPQLHRQGRRLHVPRRGKHSAGAPLPCRRLPWRGRALKWAAWIAGRARCAVHHLRELHPCGIPLPSEFQAKDRCQPGFCRPA